MIARLHPTFVTTMPERLEPGVLYVSMEYATVIHLCACGCGSEAVTPLSPTDWKLTYNGAEVTLSPSVGNWSFPCRSHYLVRSGRIEWAESWDDEEVGAGRAREARRTRAYYSATLDGVVASDVAPRSAGQRPEKSWLRKLLRL